MRKLSMGREKAVILIFLSILYLPMLLTFISKSSPYSCDVPLSGYEDKAVEPEFTIGSFWDGKYQKEFSSWFESDLKLRGIFTRTYATIQYNCFHLGNSNSIVGKKKDIFEPSYINSKLCINGYPNFSEAVYWEQMEHYIEQLEILQEKLMQYGKYLYVYIAPSKADFHLENVPQKYKSISDSDAISAAAAFSYLIRQTDIPYLICTEDQYDSEFPAFYKTGIHWSRPFEQETSVQIIEDLCRITGKEYRNILLQDIQESAAPFWRDKDVYDLLNVWNTPEELYYEYKTARENPERYDKLGILLHGDSFALGLRKDILDIYPYENIYFINRNLYVLDQTGNTNTFESWNDVDIPAMLNNVDVVILETVEPVLTGYSYGFVDHLISLLDYYSPSDNSENYVQAVDCTSEDAWHSDSLHGFYGREAGFAWVKDYCEIILEDVRLREAGLELEISVSPNLFQENGDMDVIDVYINGEKVSEYTFDEAWDGSIYISPQDLKNSARENLYDIEIYCSKSFVPYRLGINEDTRDLAIQVKYVGSAR